MGASQKIGPFSNPLNTSLPGQGFIYVGLKYILLVQYTPVNYGLFTSTDTPHVSCEASTQSTSAWAAVAVIAVVALLVVLVVASAVIWYQQR